MYLELEAEWGPKTPWRTGAEHEITTQRLRSLARARGARSECIDRMYLNVYLPQLQCIGGVVWYLRDHLGQRFASTAGHDN